MSKMPPRRQCLIFSVMMVLLAAELTFSSNGLGSDELPKGLPGRGAVLPSFTIPSPSDQADKFYLELNGEKSFQPGNLKAKLVLIEVFNVYCASCQYMRPYMNELYSKIEKDPELKGQVKMIGLGAGNDHWDIDLEKDSYEFPLFPDDDYAFHTLAGKPPTPFLIFARPYSGGRLLVVNSHLGRLEDADKLLAMTRAAFFNADISEIAPIRREKPSSEVGMKPAVPISDNELMDKVRASLYQKGDKLGEIKKIKLPDLGQIYIGKLINSKKNVFARVVARQIPCVDCHDVFFIYSFNDEGQFLRFIPIAISKLDNEEWDENDVNRIKNRFENKSLLQKVPFRRDIDAVTSATISSELIYNSMNKTRLVIEKLTDLGYISPKK